MSNIKKGSKFAAYEIGPRKDCACALGRSSRFGHNSRQAFSKRRAGFGRNIMKLMRITYISTAVATFAFAGAVTAGEANMPHKAGVSMPVTELHWGSAGVTAPNGAGTLQAAPAFGDLSKGEHGTFIKMPTGFVSAPHTHTDDYFGIVITGVGVNTDGKGKDIPLPPGSYWFQPGGQAHVTKCISTTECIFFIHQGGKFDYLPTAL